MGTSTVYWAIKEDGSETVLAHDPDAGAIPSKGEMVRFNDRKYIVESVEWTVVRRSDARPFDSVVHRTGAVVTMRPLTNP